MNKYVTAEWSTGEYPFEVFDSESRNRICLCYKKKDAETIACALNTYSEAGGVTDS